MEPPNAEHGIRLAIIIAKIFDWAMKLSDKPTMTSAHVVVRHKHHDEDHRFQRGESTEHHR
ncbi:uncharacterized protein BO87DRAFT_421032 [Aspergillus neoniger CBS 115656]|uniref:Uncharacterized protein n=1 Tax=Aspergillus neoniger (strain CBS 115656) TaxID=1448310 RepID=A0A318YZ26_ASPNB|nr:hypothetical protein BO87DRAFT_421032 [Aspergillus neoniger CBS 115656]PYH39936.1 hypothetical protein BO87DRAFT_421032 [Aspergillus neoniger CBS 115656]